ncbi:MAG: ion transporter [Flavobacteriaceae bacterium]|nr:ion transporter [Flavobacteriaceae bacterium]
MKEKKSIAPWRFKLHEIIYEADTPAGKFFDVLLLIVILASIVLVMLESVEFYAENYSELLNNAEWAVTILFTIEYICRIIAIQKPRQYIFSFYGIVDFLSTIPTYLSLFFLNTSPLIVLRALRLLRVFRILKLARYIGESNQLVKALRNSRAKIVVFLFAVFVLSIVLGTMMYLVEGDSSSGFSSIPRSVYWAIVTLTTVGYGDIAPVTSTGQFIAAIIMILGYGIIAVPTGIVSSEFARREPIDTGTQVCLHCSCTGHKDQAEFCYECGNKINE